MHDWLPLGLIFFFYPNGQIKENGIIIKKKAIKMNASYCLLYNFGTYTHINNNSGLILFFASQIMKNKMKTYIYIKINKNQPRQKIERIKCQYKLS